MWQWQRSELQDIECNKLKIKEYVREGAPCCISQNSNCRAPRGSSCHEPMNTFLAPPIGSCSSAAQSARSACLLPQSHPTFHACLPAFSWRSGSSTQTPDSHCVQYRRACSSFCAAWATFNRTTVGLTAFLEPRASRGCWSPTWRGTQIGRGHCCPRTACGCSSNILLSCACHRRWYLSEGRMHAQHSSRLEIVLW